MMSNESTIYRTKLHWMILVEPIAYLVLSILLGSLIAAITNSIGKLLSGILILIALVNALSSFLNYSKSEVLITNKRVIVQTGSLQKVSKDFGLSQIESIELDQGILGRTLGYGSIMLHGTGGTLTHLPKISNPLEIRREIEEQLSNFSSR